MFFRQIQRHGDNFSYLIADEQTREAVVVDSSYNADELTKIIQNEHLELKYIISTHSHSDHTTGNKTLQTTFKTAQTVAHNQANPKSSIQVQDGTQLNLGKVTIQVINTPGHTPDGICLLIDNQKLLTGDTLFVGECGRTDLAGGDSKQLYHSLQDKILKLNDNIELYPGHNYGAKPSSTVGYERRTNYVLKPRSETEFVDFMG
jgi:glyoxylase-like metal-dependent hydrolase (beta-lactamase superfamily II)